jgi:hypothetical protein
VLVLRARLGRRAGDVAALQGDEIHWPDGTLRVAGTNRRATRLPLPPEVGEASLCYGDHHRPAGPRPSVFLPTSAPLGPLSSKTVTKMAARARRRAPVASPISGAPVLRPSAATTLLRQGVALPSLGALLRHASIEPTTLAAQGDPPLRHPVGRAWPEVPSCEGKPLTRLWRCAGPWGLPLTLRRATDGTSPAWLWRVAIPISSPLPRSIGPPGPQRKRSGITGGTRLAGLRASWPPKTRVTSCHPRAASGEDVNAPGRIASVTTRARTCSAPPAVAGRQAPSADL